MQSKGFTLIELMVVLLIAALVLGAGIPALQNLSSEHQLAAAGSDFFHSVQLTRSEALRAGRRAEMRPSDGRDWQSGWEIRVGQQVVSRHPSLEMGIAVAYTNGADIVAYQPDGQPVTRGTWYFSSGTNARAVVINFLGRVRICNPIIDDQCSRAVIE
ncbi:prepilin-type N-terminal cleavage/methylation domain-containing protein [Herbaspirillum sp. RU 5E]|jgi:type IV fimbrial biogenesis protein FimT|uniref:Type II secretion system protein H n=1 Tax=Herbaspirillum aquaticum TaxID=568783 RepID=A0A225SQ38_9BURK|nr:MULTISPECIES: GspH/FimT family pseudopilin [Herbaspirillum]MBW9336248.1 prepilin-type N-terminal cleavage/methylation domain-containing protein [Herbaspirillum sp. RU 5E]MRT28284.1 prepilin-type N-terminal cleavage/methylation domain-containing protein [Herbaspirillum sp. CAH-3]OWY33253.1 pilus assembly protein [Herbaspirillum aquaticum]